MWSREAGGRFQVKMGNARESLVVMIHTFPNSFAEASITLIPNQTLKENYNPISLINMDIKILKKILANQILTYKKDCIP